MIRLYEYVGEDTEFELYRECKNIYDNLRSLAYNGYYEFNYEDVINRVKEMFNSIDGTVAARNSVDCVNYNGRVESYTIGGSIYKTDGDKCFNRLIEDLTMAYYRNNGGKAPNTYVFLHKLRDM